MFVQVLRNPSEVRKADGYFEEIPDVEPDADMLQMAERLIEQKTVKFDPANYDDRYEEALMAMIKEKLKGHKPIIAAAPERGNVVNLMDALKASLAEQKPPAKSQSRSKAPAKSAPKPAAKPAAKSDAAKSAGSDAKAAPKRAASGGRKSAK